MDWRMSTAPAMTIHTASITLNPRRLQYIEDHARSKIIEVFCVLTKMLLIVALLAAVASADLDHGEAKHLI